MNIIDFDNNYQDCMSYYLTKSYPKHSFYLTLKDLSLKESDIGINDDEFHNIFEINNNYFKYNMLCLIFPIFLKEIASSTHNYSKIYEIDNNLYNDIRIIFQTKEELLSDLNEIEENQQSKIIKVPNVKKDEELKFEI